MTTALATAPAFASTAPPSGAVPVTSAGAPQTIPGLADWSGSAGTLTVDESLEIGADAASEATALLLIDDLSSRLNRQIGATDAPGAGDVSLLRDDSRLADLGAEGYEITVDDSIRIVAATDDGVFWGAQSVVQILAQGTEIPRGTSIDVPEYEERGVGICACQITSGVDWILRLIKDMSYVKLNQLWLETKVESAGYENANFWGYFTTAEAEQISDAAKKYHVDIVPEVNSPGHMSPWLRNYPELQLVDTRGQRDANRLDITQPAAYEMITTLIDEYFAVFDTDYWHMGGDEYMLGSAYANYPQFQSYIDDNPDIFPSGATPTDVVTHFMNRIDDYVQSKGKTLRIWNDGQLTGTTLALNKDIVVEHWTGGQNLVSSQELIDQGHAVQNSAYSLYLIRGTGPDPLKPEKLWNENWTPQSFEDGSRVTDNDASGGYITGAKITAWPDYAVERTENEVEESLFAGTRFIAQSTWGSARPVATYGEFAALTERIGRVPGYENVERTPLSDGEFAIITDGESFALDGGDRTLSASDASTSFRFEATADHYYSIRSADGQCLTLRGGTLTLGAPLDQGLAPTFAGCAAEDNLQKWQLRETDGGYTIANAIALLPLVVQDGTLVQQAPDVQAPAVFTLTGPFTAQLTVDGSVSRGGTASATLSVTNNTASGASGVTSTLNLPQGWGASADITRTLGDLESGGDASAQFPLIVSRSAAASPTELTADVTYSDAAGVSHTVKAAAVVRVTCSAEEASPTAVVRVDSAESAYENTPGSNAIDGDPSTFWGTEWSQTNPGFPHEITVDLGEGASTCGIGYLPRQGSPNGAVEGYEVYVSDSAASPSGDPVASGEFPATGDKSYVSFPAPAAGRYLTLRALGESGPIATNTTSMAELTVDRSTDDPATASPTLSLSTESARPGDSLSVTVAEGAAFWQYGLELRSDPASLGNVRTDADGGATLSVTIPAGTAPGEHSVVLLDGQSVVARASLAVTDGSGQPTSSPTPSGTPTGPRADPTGAAGPTSGNLASTGFGGSPFAWVAGILLIAGVGVSVLSRRAHRRRES